MTDGMSDPMHAEFDTVAAWTAAVAADLGPEFRVPAACRGSGSPAALDWLLDHLELRGGETLLDSGAGLGGPAGYAFFERGARPLLAEPERDAIRAAHRLFGLPSVCADAGALPVADGRFDAAWSLGVMCTMDDQLGLLRELRRVTAPPHRVGLLVYVAHRDRLTDPPEGNNFPSAVRVVDLVGQAGLRLQSWQSASTLASPSEHWRRRTAAVEEELERRHGAKQAWQVAERQSGRIGALISDGQLSAELLSLRAL
jgi:SAM-dependent methyltransferase